MVRYITCGACARWVPTFRSVESPSSLYLISGFALCGPLGSVTSRCTVSSSAPFYMVALHVIHPIVLRAEDLRIDPRASNDPYTIAQMVEDSYGADYFPLPSHGWPPPNEVTQWLDAAPLLFSRPRIYSSGPPALTSPRWR